MQKQINSLGANEILELIFIYLTEISSLHDYDETIKLLANMGRALTNADRCSIWIVSDDNKSIWTKVAHGIDAIEVPMGSGIVGAAIESGSRIIIDDVYKDKRFNAEIDKKSGYRTKSMLVVPLYDNDENIIGAFQAINRRGEQDYFDKRDLERLMLASTYAAETIVASKLEEEITETQREVVFTMGAIGESRSKETGNHVKRVAEYSKIIALGYGLSKEEAELLKQASPMHDIGKVAIPDSILNKPGRFDENEREIMNRHAELGYQMIKSSTRPLLQAASIVAYEHHEKWDGTGYPRGLKGEEIHIYGRISALADVFDALGSDRVYKKAWSDEKIFKLIKEERAKHFDPKIVDVFFEHLDEILAVRAAFQDQYNENSYKHDKEEKTVKILGAYGTKGKGKGTTSVLLNKNNVVDAGNLLDGLDVASTDIDTIWLTHSHLDHISDIAYILDNYFSLRRKSLKICGLAETLEVVKNNYLNDLVWPDFSKIKLQNSDEYAVTYEEVMIGKKYAISKNETIEAFLTDHTVASCGYIYTYENNKIAITADTYSLENIQSIIETDSAISMLIVECSFPNEMEKLAIKSKHLTPKLLFEALNGFKRKDFELYINHVKPSYEEKIIKQIEENRGKWQPKILNDGDFITF
jgi:HD-GYP domain-containing protein (c-di-GMP phosphodiesterase class II)/ribonuclease BN (tRNA processing enzyme)